MCFLIPFPHFCSFNKEQRDCQFQFNLCHSLGRMSSVSLLCEKLNWLISDLPLSLSLSPVLAYLCLDSKITSILTRFILAVGKDPDAGGGGVRQTKPRDIHSGLDFDQSDDQKIHYLVLNTKKKSFFFLFFEILSSTWH